MSIQQKGLDIIASSKALIVNTIGRDGRPNSRILYSYANEGFTIYFSTGAATEKFLKLRKTPK